MLHATDVADQRAAGDRLRGCAGWSLRDRTAEGVLAERLDITTTEAFERLRSAADREDVLVAEIAGRVIETGDTAG